MRLYPKQRVFQLNDNPTFYCNLVRVNYLDRLEASGYPSSVTPTRISNNSLNLRNEPVFL